MKKDRILNPQIISSIAAIGHTEYYVLADAGLPIPEGVECIDISLTRGIPTFLQVLQAVADELVIESYIYASELPGKNPALQQSIEGILKGLPSEHVPHSEFKKLTESAKAVIRTGETSSFANLILIAGVNF